jgi:hypothetical protein
MTIEELKALGADLNRLNDFDYDFIDDIEDAETEQSHNQEWKEYFQKLNYEHEKKICFGTDKCFMTEKYVWSLTPDDDDYYKTFCLLTNSQGHSINKCLIDYWLEISEPLRGHSNVESWLNETYHYVTCMIHDDDRIINDRGLSIETKTKLLAAENKFEYANIPNEVNDNIELQNKLTLDYYKKIIDLWCTYFHPRSVEKHLDYLLFYQFDISIYDAYEYLFDLWDRKYPKNN